MCSVCKLTDTLFFLLCEYQDYFEVIDTPMDFGTICSNLENGVKYLNSKDVYKDVELIWNNCFKYNNKGDYVVDLMKRVKKNFTKNWTAAGLYSEPQQGNLIIAYAFFFMMAYSFQNCLFIGLIAPKFIVFLIIEMVI